MDLLLAVAVWALGAWVAYRWVRTGRHRSEASAVPGRPRALPHHRTAARRRHP